MNLSKIYGTRSWKIWGKSGALANKNGPVHTKIYAISQDEMQQFGCSHCGYRSGSYSISGGGSGIWNCGDCGKTTVVLGDGIKKSTFGIGSIVGSIYPKKKKHPRFGIPSHGAPDVKPEGGGEFFRSRGIGLDLCTCFICGTDDRTNSGKGRSYLNNICAFVSCKDAGERVVVMFKQGARLDYRDYEPDRVQIKIGACDKHLPMLKSLDQLVVDNNDIITKELIEQSIIEY